MRFKFSKANELLVLRGYEKNRTLMHSFVRESWRRLSAEILLDLKRGKTVEATQTERLVLLLCEAREPFSAYCFCMFRSVCVDISLQQFQHSIDSRNRCEAAISMLPSQKQRKS